MKKLFVAILSIILCVSLAACESSDYKQAEELYAAGDYASALDLYVSLGEYEDSQDKVKLCKFQIANAHFEAEEYKAALESYTELGEYEDAQDKAAFCEREVGMTENADYAFLADIEASVLNRMAKSDLDDYTTLVNTELAYVQKYSDKTFYDDKLRECADTYIEGLLVQKEALGKEYYYEYQIEWMRGMVLRFDALVYLYENYDFLSDNPDFIGTYISQYEDKKHTLAGYYAIEEDIGAQTESEDFKWYLDDSGYYVYCTLTNNTEYTYGLYMDISFIDEDGIMFETNTGYVEEVKPGTTFVMEVYISDADRVDTWNWMTYYDYVK